MDRHGGLAMTRLAGGVLSGTDVWSRQARRVRERATRLARTRPSSRPGGTAMTKILRPSIVLPLLLSASVLAALLAFARCRGACVCSQVTRTPARRAKGARLRGQRHAAPAPVLCSGQALRELSAHGSWIGILPQLLIDLIGHLEEPDVFVIAALPALLLDTWSDEYDIYDTGAPAISPHYWRTGRA